MFRGTGFINRSVIVQTFDFIFDTNLFRFYPPPPLPTGRQAAPPPERLCHNRNPGAEAVGFQSFRMRGFYVRGNRRLYKAKCIHVLGTLESEHLKVTALNLFHPTASSPFQ